MKTVMLTVLAFVLGGLAVWWFVPGPASPPGSGPDQTVHQPERQVLYYRHPHSPQITSDKPIQDEMGMDYIPIYADDDGGGGSAIRIAPEMTQNLGVRTAVARRETVTPTIEAFAVVDYNEQRLSHVHVRAEGWVEELAVRSLGERVRQGELLFTWYSPPLVNAQEEYLRTLAGGSERVREASRERLAALGVAPATIAALPARGRPFQLLPVYAPADGVVTQIGVRDGMYIMPALDLLTLADLSTVWIYVDLFEHQARQVTVGQQATLSLVGSPGEPLTGSVEFLSPQLDPQTRTVRARLRFPNEREQLKPNMYGRAKIILPARQDVLLVPRQALISSGDRQRVVVAREDGRFAPAEVSSGAEYGDRVEIVDGLTEGDRVVVSAQFLLDSEASLRAAFTRMEPLEAANGEAVEAAPQVVWSNGTYHGPGRKQGTISLSHEPIAEFGWPAMTMDLPLAPGVTADQVSPGSPIRFQLERLDEITYRILAIEGQPGGDQP